MKRPIAIAIAALALARIAPAQQPPAAASLLRVEARMEPASVAPGGTGTLRIRATLSPGWHCNAHVPSEEYLIPTSVTMAPARGIAYSAWAYPPPLQKKFSFSDRPLAVYEGAFEVTARVQVASGAAAGAIELPGTLRFQPCNDSQCLAPATVAFSGKATVAGGTPAAGTAGGAAPNPFGDGRGWLSTLVLLFLGGLALNLTPCVYPVIPITVSFFGGQAEGGRARPVRLALFYVLGMAAMYSALGVFAALSGRLFGTALQSPWVLGGISLVMVALALSMFGFYEIQPPRFLLDRAGARTGSAGAFGMGLLVGIVAAPCLGPFVLGLLTYVASQHDPVQGFAMFFVLSVGLGFPYLFLAAFSGAISKLPRAGAWMVEIKRLFGFILLAMAAYFARVLFSGPVHDWLLPAVLAVGGVFVLFSILRSKAPPMARAIVGAGAVLLLAASARFAPARHPAGGTLPFRPYDAAAIAAAGRPVMIDFSADWCIPCHELDDVTFSNPRVREKLRGFALFRADMTREGSPEAVALARQYGIEGMPTVVFLDAAGKEVRAERLVGYEPPEAFLARLARLPS